MARRPAEVWFVYILRCADGTLYAGITKDVERRTKQHNGGTASRYTRSRCPVKLVYQETQRSHSVALKREAAIKRLTRREKLALIQRKRRDGAGRTIRVSASSTVRPTARRRPARSPRPGRSGISSNLHGR